MKALKYLGDTVLDHLPDEVEVGLDKPLYDLTVSLLPVIQLPTLGVHDWYLRQQVDWLHWGHRVTGAACLAFSSNLRRKDFKELNILSKELL